MISISNGLSFVRAPLALLFCQESPGIRLTAIFLAMVTDCVDGYVARRNKSVTQFGAILDPVMDKFFVLFSLSILMSEGRIAPLEMSTMLSRDFFVLLYGLLMVAAGRWKTVIIRAIRWGKITTALQFLVLMALTLGYSIPSYIYGAFIVMGFLAFLELIKSTARSVQS